MTEIFNLRTLCRCCHSDGSFKSLQLSYAYDNRIEVYSTMLKETFNVTISPPTFDASYAICDDCIEKLRSAAHFKQQVLDCELKFGEYCSNEQALLVKAEIDYEISNDYDSSTHNTSIDVYDNDGEKYKKSEDEEHDVKIKTSKVCGINDLHDDDDEQYSVKIKEENGDTLAQSIQQTLPVESVKTDKAGAVVADTILKKHGFKDTVAQSIQQTLPVESVKTDKAGAVVADTILKKHGFKARVRKRANYSVDFELESHINTEGGSSYVCKMCDKKYKFLKLLRTHIIKQHEDAYTCKYCSLQCSGRLHYVRHKKTHNSSTFICHHCDKVFRRKYRLRLHLNVHTQTEKYQCDICRKIFFYKQTLKKHILWHSGVTKKFMCDICGHSFRDTTNLNTHIRVVHEKQRPFKCHLCSKTFKLNKHLKEHSYFHTGERPYKCQLCNDAFVTSSRLKYHLIRYHPNSSAGQAIKTYTCKVCKLELTEWGKYKYHLQKHVGRKKYECHLCLKNLSCKYSLNRHIVSHSGHKAYGCDMCGKKYTQQTMLLRHKKKIHDPNSLAYPGRNVERVKCDLCNKSFKDIKKHMISHKSRPHVCEFCRKCYPERNTLNRHILFVHQGVKRHPCTLCEKKYTRWEGLKKHTKKVHKLELKRKVDKS